MSGFRHVILYPVPIEINLLCDLLENICRGLILAVACQRDVKVHNVTLPRSWLMKSISVEEAKKTKVSLIGLFVSRSIRDLLNQVYSGRFAGRRQNLVLFMHGIYIFADHLLYGNRTMAAKLPSRVRTVFISRMCVVFILTENKSDVCFVY